MAEAQLQDVPNRHELARRRVGTVLGGKWTLTHLLGLGGMAAVYAAEHRNGAKAAIKFLPFGVTTSPALCQRFLREGYLANKIEHPTIVRVLDDHIDHEKEYAYLVMELLEGETARECVERDGPLPAIEALDLMIQLADCLRAAHAANVIHRDIKPENLFITTDGLKVLDFGIARAMDTEHTSLTRTGASLGTPAYMSPEQARGKNSEISTATDIYSFGATMLFLLTGVTLHEGESAQELMVRAAWTPPLKARQRCPALHPTLANIIDKACAFEPKNRYASSDHLHAALTDARLELIDHPPDTILRHSDFHLHAIPAPTPLPTDLMETLAESATPDFRYNRRGLVAAAAVFVVTAGGYLAFSWLTSEPAEAEGSTTSKTSTPGQLPTASEPGLSGVAPEPAEQPSERPSDAVNQATPETGDSVVRPTQLPKAPKAEPAPRPEPLPQVTTPSTIDETRGLRETTPPGSSPKPSRETTTSSAKRPDNTGKSATGRDLGY